MANMKLKKVEIESSMWKVERSMLNVSFLLDLPKVS